MGVEDVIKKGGSGEATSYQPEGTVIGDPRAVRDVARQVRGHKGWLTHPVFEAMDVAARARGDDRSHGRIQLFGVLGLCLAIVSGVWVMPPLMTEGGPPEYLPWQMLPFVVGALAFIVCFAIVGPHWRTKSSVRGKEISGSVAFLVREDGLATFVYDSDEWRRNDLPATEVRSVRIKDEDEAHVTVTVEGVDGDWVLPWIPRRPELVDTILSWESARRVAA